jgi:hypothetical protein
MTWAWLLSWWRNPAPRLEKLEVVLYTRRGCHLCETAWQQLRQRQRRHGFRLTVIDVDGDPHLVEQFGTCVPVVAVNGRVRFRGRVNPVLFDRLLRGESERRA